MSVDEWTTQGVRINDADVLLRLRRMIDDESSLIVEHWFYRGASAPHRFVCDDADELEEYLRDRAKAGDSFLVWSFENCCTDDRIIERGKVPDQEGRTPIGGAY